MKLSEMYFIVGILFINYIISSFLSLIIHRILRKIPIKQLLRYALPGRKLSHYKKILNIITIIWISLLYNKYRISIEFFMGLILLYIFCIISFVDYEAKIIPDLLNGIIFILGIICLLFFNKLTNINLNSRLMGLVIAIIITIVMTVLSKLLNKELIGGGDLKLFMAISLIIGDKLLIIGIFIASFLAMISYPLLLINKEKRENLQIPFGPYLSVSFMLMYIYGIDLIKLYMEVVK